MGQADERAVNFGGAHELRLFAGQGHGSKDRVARKCGKPESREVDPSRMFYKSMFTTKSGNNPVQLTNISLVENRERMQRRVTPQSTRRIPVAEPNAPRRTAPAAKRA